MNKIHMNWITFAAYKNHASDFLKNVPGHKDQPPTFSFENFSIRFSKEQSPAKSIIVLIILQPLEKKSHNWLLRNLKLQRRALLELY